MTTINTRYRSGARAARYATFCLFALLAVLCLPGQTRAQWVTSGTNTTTTNNVGIGTSSPAALLDLRVDTGDVVSRFSNAGGAAGALDVRYKYESSQHRMGLSDGNGQWLFYTQFAPSNLNSVGFFPGNVGIGTAAPAHRLDVSGAVNASGGLCILGDCRTSWSQASGGWTSNGTNTNLANGAVNIWSGARAAVPGGYMKPGSLTIGSIVESYGGGTDWTSNTAGLMLETVADTEIAVHDSYSRVASLMRYEGDAANRITIGRNMGWGTISTIALSGNVGVGTSTPSSKLHVAGDIRVDGNINAKYQDVAEWVPSREKLEAGTVVILDAERSNQVLASVSSYDTKVAGVVSPKPGISLGDAGEGKVLVATTGRVKVKVDATLAPIKIGDLLVTSDVTGVAMKSEPIALGKRRIHEPGTIIGKALESLDKGTGEILVLLSLQ
jgi:hypothetical protein